MAIKILSNVLLTDSDREYKQAVNYKGFLYNDPITITIDGRKYIIGAGASDDVTLFKDGDNIYILTSNRRIGYIGLEMIDPDKWTLHDIIFLQGGQIEENDYIPNNILDISVRRQLKSLRLYEE